MNPTKVSESNTKKLDMRKPNDTEARPCFWTCLGYGGRFSLVPPPRLTLSIFLSVMVSIGIGTLLGAVFLFQSAANVLLLSSTTVSLALIGSYRSFRVPDKPVEELLSPIIE